MITRDGILWKNDLINYNADSTLVAINSINAINATMILFFVPFLLMFFPPSLDYFFGIPAENPILY